MTICIDIISKGMVTCICLWLQSHRDRDPQPQPQKYVVFNQLASSFCSCFVKLITKRVLHKTPPKSCFGGYQITAVTHSFQVISQLICKYSSRVHNPLVKLETETGHLLVKVGASYTRWV